MGVGFGVEEESPCEEHDTVDKPPLNVIVEALCLKVGCFTPKVNPCPMATLKSNVQKPYLLKPTTKSHNIGAKTQHQIY